MKAAELRYERPAGLDATTPPEQDGRDVRLLVSTPRRHVHTTFDHLPAFLEPGDLLVVNDSATVAASLVATADLGTFRLNVATRYASRLWLAEPRWDHATPGPLPMRAGDGATVCSGDVRFIAPYPGTDRLWFVDGDLEPAVARCGEPIRYGYVTRPQPLDAYRSIFARVPGSAEMPSAARPFTTQIVEALRAKGIGVVAVRLHTGLSSLEVETDDVEDHPIPPEPFRVSVEAADAVNAATRVIAVGTTVVRALESAWRDGRVEPAQGFTRAVITPERGLHVIDGMLTGLHDPGASHLAMLHAVAGPELVRSAYEELIAERYRWHEFGDSHLLLP